MQDLPYGCYEIQEIHVERRSRKLAVKVILNMYEISISHILYQGGKKRT